MIWPVALAKGLSAMADGGGHCRKRKIKLITLWYAISLTHITRSYLIRAEQTIH